MKALTIAGNDLRLKIPMEEDTDIVHRYFEENQNHLSQWEPIRAEDFYNVEVIRQRLWHMWKDAEQGLAYQFVIVDATGTEMLGACNFSGIARGPFQACHLGYSIAARHEGKGIMLQALTAAIDYLWGELDLHRIMAAYIPTNARSEKLLLRLGFEKEGYAKSYLKIAGRWQDHILTSLINPRHTE
ncbi:GNAT family N-acetyltransferase [Pseudomonas lundensis]|uniref:GNAT family N-acetyltransferase n=1 Tax=Serratia proteamaculans TaxID=28151 RepID=UPI0029819E58|nr:GNAT family N-acetyltransferase [Serratia proteamaculans]MDW5499704.1 GNAT family N-acetyltransferase [Serratia proteamaculans]MDW5504766.1 GNAT family N-acetyltransferase [Pseudomonas lundensis]